jgi:hypothetical protein
MCVQECEEKQLQNVGALEFHKKCGPEMVEAADQTVRQRALEALPGSRNTTDPVYQAVQRCPHPLPFSVHTHLSHTRPDPSHPSDSPAPLPPPSHFL